MEDAKGRVKMLLESERPKLLKFASQYEGESGDNAKDATSSQENCSDCGWSGDGKDIDCG